jgi:hypothetical protein
MTGPNTRSLVLALSTALTCLPARSLQQPNPCDHLPQVTKTKVANLVLDTRLIEQSPELPLPTELATALTNRRAILTISEPCYQWLQWNDGLGWSPITGE